MSLEKLSKNITAQSNPDKCKYCDSDETFAAEHYQTAWFNVICCEKCQKWSYFE